MKLISEPSVFLVGRQTVHQNGMRDFLARHGLTWDSDAPSAGEYLAETAGRLCYMSFSNPRPGGNEAYLTHILEASHGSVLEHIVLNFLVTGVSRSLTHELVRHRAGIGISQLSQRYVDESAAEYVVPRELIEEVTKAESLFERTYGKAGMRPELLQELMLKLTDTGDTETEAGLKWLHAVATAHEAYKDLTHYLSAKLSSIEDKTLRRKTARQTARSVLPNATETKIFLTFNARALRHVVEMRCSRHADAEIRKLAGELYMRASFELPNLFSDYTVVHLDDGTFEVTTPHRKV